MFIHTLPQLLSISGYISALIEQGGKIPEGWHPAEFPNDQVSRIRYVSGMSKYNINPCWTMALQNGAEWCTPVIELHIRQTGSVMPVLVPVPVLVPRLY